MKAYPLPQCRGLAGVTLPSPAATVLTVVVVVVVVEGAISVVLLLLFNSAFVWDILLERRRCCFSSLPHHLSSFTMTTGEAFFGASTMSCSGVT